MRIETIPCLADNLSYLVVDDETKTCIAIDTGEAQPFFDAIETRSLRLIAILATHHHYDHVGAISQFKDVPVWSSKRDLERVPAAQGASERHVFTDDTALSWSQLAGDPTLGDCKIELRTLSIPGHTEGQTALIFSEGRDATEHVFVGDTLFAYGCGRCLEGTPEVLFESLGKIKTLPPNVRIYFGHEYTEKNALFWLSHATLDSNLIDSESIKDALARHSRAAMPKPAPTLAEEMGTNPFLKIKNASEFRRWRELRNQF